jgi:hypothetical protein
MRLKLVGVLLLAAMGALALTGASSASADAFCRDALNPCHEGYAPPTPFTAVAKSAVLKGTSFEVVCKSVLEGESTSYLKKGEGVNAKIVSLTFSGCIGTCTSSSATALPYSMRAKATGAGNGTATLSSGGEGTPGLSLGNCTGLKQTCTYSASKIPLTFVGGKGGSEASDATLSASSVTLTKGLGPCPATVTLTAKYIAEKVGIQTHASWWWEEDEPIVTWFDYDYGEVEPGTTSWVTFTIEFNVEVAYEEFTLINNSAGVFSKGQDNCSKQTIGANIKCSIEVGASPKEHEKTYEATLKGPWKEVGGSNFGTINIRLRVKGTPA